MLDGNNAVSCLVTEAPALTRKVFGENKGQEFVTSMLRLSFPDYVEALLLCNGTSWIALDLNDG